MFLGKLHEALAEFLRLVQQEDLPKSVIATHLRYPRTTRSTLVGSDIGARLWDSTQGKGLIDTLLYHPQLGEWFGESVAEIQGRIAALVTRWSATDEVPAEAVADEWTQLLLDDLLIIAPKVERYSLLFGVEIGAYCDLGDGIAIGPIQSADLTNLLRDAGAPDVDWMRLPARPASLAILNLAAARESFGPLAATHASVWGMIEIEWLMEQLWMATGEMPRVGDQFVFERANFPVNPFERQVALPQELHQSWGLRSAVVDHSVLQSIVVRVRGARRDESTASEPLHLLLRYVDLTHRSVDPIAVLTLGYGAIDGFLRRKDEPDTLVRRRFAALVGSDATECRFLRSVLEAWYQLRSFMSHGERPKADDVGRFLRGLTTSGSTATRNDGDVMIHRSRELLRRFLLTTLWVSVRVDDARVVGIRSRDQIVSNIDAAIAKQSFARPFDSIIPSFVTEIAI